MPAQRIDGKLIAQTIEKTIATKVKRLRRRGITPSLAVLLVGKHKASETYVRKKAQAAKRVGIDFTLHRLPGNTSRKKIIETLRTIQKDPRLSGLIVQLPLPEPLYTRDVLNSIDPTVDVDCLSDENFGKLVAGYPRVTPPTPGAIFAILKHLQISLRGKQVTIVGTGLLVGRPLATMLMNAEATVTTCNIYTKNLADVSKKADILISAVGKKGLITGSMVKKGAIVIDAGVDFVNNDLFGDVDQKTVIQKASFLTPTPGGVGPLTVSHLLSNVVLCAERRFLPTAKTSRKNLY
ncbi:MAG TPA: bifunctional methylenetetrahydrofolate dehydrogenase/methenyltetrahydrofolate cyclohydrolase [Candidatus Magasanikbacteria bacterium]|nr:MAG: hypothetical protein A3I74_00645 [Candidatus Magasanikbacteria bacterium RIFCSPLOWO2_02_FULL_47_16]OGH80041.1 MAG: hypothetical protein A3C10_02580 [Candidatus Magasanikbacteria bacterium RIFCSPHIGHO2_02_FULL_48_18]OGH81851.1 MAG: hypothetical protein A3G08_03075 [Candidatus Magasanikbacteria bacterium RIFCSPLOWO2_12_FULL_47_9b]HAZ28478.1 bifunctional methylenetetrahydrofolate dehydrogenase/methenyltetrahydrofolate cyclohydrolase [Candidatus Magasanikbacteria bacterium]